MIAIALTETERRRLIARGLIKEPPPETRGRLGRGELRGAILALGGEFTVKEAIAWVQARYLTTEQSVCNAVHRLRMLGQLEIVRWTFAESGNRVAVYRVKAEK